MMNETNWTNETLSYMIFMANAWSESVCKAIYGKVLGEHIWNKYLGYVHADGLYAAMSKMIFELDSENLKKLIDYACSKYNGRASR